MGSLCFFSIAGIIILIGFLFGDKHSRVTPPPPVDDDNSFIEDMILLDILGDDDHL
jgi:hypothetical protein